MGYSNSNWSFFEDHYWSLKPGIKVIELGIQSIRAHLRPVLKVGPNKDARQARKFFEDRGCEYSTIDLRGEPTYRFDLTKIIPKTELFGQFDLVTNNGTSEHVEPRSGQYNCFKNMHLLTKVGGVMMHAIPMLGSYRRHFKTIIL